MKNNTRTQFEMQMAMIDETMPNGDGVAVRITGLALPGFMFCVPLGTTGLHEISSVLVMQEYRRREGYAGGEQFNSRPADPARVLLLGAPSDCGH